MRNVAQPSPAEAMTSFVSWLEENGLELELFYDYSGRAMFGAQCFGIAGDLAEIQAALLDFALSNPEMGEAVREAVKGQRFDNMGLDMIMYFPGVKIDPPSSR